VSARTSRSPAAAAVSAHAVAPGRTVSRGGITLPLRPVGGCPRPLYDRVVSRAPAATRPTARLRASRARPQGPRP
jgi:hypothetical protein